MEQISAFMDDELEGPDVARVLRRLDDSAEARECWSTYHLIGDALRGRHSSVDVAGKVAAALQSEPTALAPRPRSVLANRAMTYAFSAAASLSAVAVVGWMAFSTQTPTLAPVELAKEVPVAETHLVSAPADGAVNDYLLAHQGVSPSSGLQGVAPYIRTISTLPAAER